MVEKKTSISRKDVLVGDRSMIDCVFDTGGRIGVLSSNLNLTGVLIFIVLQWAKLKKGDRVFIALGFYSHFDIVLITLIKSHYIGSGRARWLDYVRSTGFSYIVH